MLTPENMKLIAMVVPYPLGYEVIYKEGTFGEWITAGCHRNRVDAEVQKNKIINSKPL